MNIYPHMNFQDDFGGIIVHSTENAGFNACIAFIMSARYEEA